MFDKIKKRLKDIENNPFKNENVKEELEKIQKTITEVKREIIHLEEKTKELSDHIKGQKVEVA